MSDSRRAKGGEVRKEKEAYLHEPEESHDVLTPS